MVKLQTRQHNNEHQKYYIYFLYTLLFVFIAAIIFSQFILYDKTLIWKEDGFKQWYSILVKFRSVWGDLIKKGDLSFWSWDTGLGADLIGNYAFIFCDPFNYIVAFFSKDKIDIAYSLIIVLKMYAAGLMMLCFLRYHKNKKFVCLAGALSYTFCACGFLALQHDFFMTQLVIFPLLILGVDKVRVKESPGILIFSVFFSIINSLYFSYMTAIFVCFYIVIVYICEKSEKSFVGFFKYLIPYIIYAVLGGVILAAPVLLPVLYSLLQASTDSGTSYQILPTITELFRSIIGVAGNYEINTSYSVVGMSALIVMMLPAMVMKEQRKQPAVIMLFICFIAAVFPLFQTVLNGFSYATMRWGYIFTFFFICAAAKCMKKEIYLSEAYRRNLCISTIVLAVITVFSLITQMISVKELALLLVNVLMGMFICIAVIKYSGHSDKMEKILLVLCALNLIIIPFMDFHPNIGGRMSNFMTTGRCYELYEGRNLKVGSKIKDSDFYRIDTADSSDNSGKNVPFTHVPANYSLYWEVPSLSEYLSTLDSNWLKYNALVGNGSGYYQRVASFSNDNRAALDYLLGVRYFLGNDERKKDWNMNVYAGHAFEKKKKIDKVSLFQSKYETGLGYVFDSAIKESDFMNYSALEREQLLMQGVMLSDEDFSDLDNLNNLEKQENSILLKKIPYQFKETKELTLSDQQIEVEQKNAKLTLQLKEKIKNSEVYLVFHGLKKKPYTVDDLWAFTQKNSGLKLDRLSKHNFYYNNRNYEENGSFSIYINKGDIQKRVVNAEGNPQAVTGNTEYIINLGYYEECEGDILCDFDTIGRYQFESIEVIAVPQDNFNRQAKKLEKNRLCILNKKSDYMAGTVYSQNGGLLYLSILYHDGWKILIDGQEAEKVYRTNQAFMGVPVSGGTHKIELIYRPVGWPYSLYVFLAGIGCSCVIVIQYRRKKGKNNE